MRKPWKRLSGYGFMVFNATFNNNSAISWRSVLLVEETRENRRPVARHSPTLCYKVVSRTPRHERLSFQKYREVHVRTVKIPLCNDYNAPVYFSFEIQVFFKRHNYDPVAGFHLTTIQHPHPINPLWCTEQLCESNQ